jgi:hypothetical protein
VQAVGIAASAMASMSVRANFIIVSPGQASESRPVLWRA